MATDATLTHGPALETWLAHLDAQGFAVGLRERLVVQRLMLQLAAQGELPDDPKAMLALAMPLLCTKPEQQRRYKDLLRAFSTSPAADQDRVDATLAPVARREQRRSRLLLALAVLLAVAMLGSLGHFIWKTVRQSGAAAAVPPSPPASAAAPASSPAPAPRAASQADDGLQVYMPARPLITEFPDESGWRTPLQVLLVTLGSFAAVLLVGQLWARRKRQLYLQGVRSDEAVREHLLRDAHPVDVGPPPNAARAVARALRQRVEGDSLALDVAATLRASVRAGGALAPRWRALQRTPEYLVLVEQRHEGDHHSAYVHALLDALADAGVALDVWHFDGTPALGCWPAALGFGSDAALGRRLGVTELLTRHTGHRLLVFGPVQALLDPLRGSPQRWTASLGLLPQRAWFTPMPLQAWGPAEAQADALGFLLLPQQPGALDTLAGWLASQRLELAVQADWPLSYPAMLRDNLAGWAAREAPPDADTVAELLFQLRTALGPQRLRWLWACAVFPALSPPLTLALGRELMPGDPRALALGMSALAALPWFRYGRLPDWLREALLDDMAAKEPELQQRLRPFISQCLDSALLDGNAPVLARVATPQRVAAWLRRGRGLARDLVMVRFLEEGSGSRLLQRLPPGLRQRLFRKGLPALGPRLGVLAWALAAACVALSISWSSPWPLLPLPLMAAAWAGRRGWRWMQGHSPKWQARWFVNGRAADGLRWPGRLVLSAQAACIAYAVFWPYSQVPFVFETDGPLTMSRHVSVFDDKLPDSPYTAMRFTDDGLALVVQMASGGQFQVDLRTKKWVLLPAGPAFTPQRSAQANQGRVRIGFDPDGTLRIRAQGTDGQWRGIDSHPDGADFYDFLALSPDGERLALGGSSYLGVFQPSDAPYPGRTHVALVDCEGARLVSMALRDKADAALATDSHLQVVAYTPEAFDRLHGKAARDAAPSIRWGNLKRSAEAPDKVLAVEQWAKTRWPGVDWKVSSVDDEQADPVVAVSACTGQADAGAPVQQDADAALKARVARMFDADAQVRVQATTGLEADLAHLSEAVPLALEQALAALSAAGKRVDNTTASGVINTMVLLEAASPETLRVNGPAIADLLQRAAAIGSTSASRAKGVALLVAKAAQLRPRVTIRHADAAQRPLALALQQQLRALKYEVPDPEILSGADPAATELRVLGFSDRGLVTEISAAVETLLYQRPQVVPLAWQVGNDSYELWLDAAACVTRGLPACQPSAPAAAPAPTKGQPNAKR